MNDARQELFGMILQLSDRRLLVPRSALCAVIAYTDPEPLQQVHEWLLGMIEWNGKRVPLVTFEGIAGGSIPAVGANTRAVVLAAPGGRLDPPCLAMLVQEHPRPAHLDADSLLAQDAEPGAECILAQVMLGNERLVIPALEWIEMELAQVLVAEVAP